MTEPSRLKGHPFAKGLSDEQVAELESCGHLERFPQGHLIFREGGEAHAVYLVLSGRVALEQHVPGRGDLQLENLAGGDLLGLSWLFPKGRWLLDARAVEPTEALVLDAACIHARMNADAPLGLAVARHVIEQLYRRLERVRLQRLDVYRGAP